MCPFCRTPSLAAIVTFLIRSRLLRRATPGNSTLAKWWMRLLCGSDEDFKILGLDVSAEVAARNTKIGATSGDLGEERIDSKTNSRMWYHMVVSGSFRILKGSNTTTLIKLLISTQIIPLSKMLAKDGKGINSKTHRGLPSVNLHSCSCPFFPRATPT